MLEELRSRRSTSAGLGGTDLILLNLESALLEAWIFIPRQWVGDGEGRWVLGCFEDF